MARSGLALEVAGSTLLAVPAVHYRLAFAEEVNRLCSNPATRPEAITVELGPAATFAARAWMLELGIGPEGRVSLPCMLGLIDAEGAEESGGHLPARELLPFSPTDSIIEAIRCSCELGVPVYGVDLEHSLPLVRPPSLLLQDPIVARREGAASYINANLDLASFFIDEGSFPARELCMATRLKAALAHHRRVLFTCGMGHWQRLVGLLHDVRIEPASRLPSLPDSASFRSFDRVVIDPQIAVRHMDLFPAVALEFERLRAHASGGPIRQRPGVDPERLLRGVLEAVLGSEPSRASGSGGSSEAALLAELGQVVSGLALTSLQQAVDLWILVRAAEATMPPRFRRALVRQLMQFPWATQGEHPGAGYLRESPLDCTGKLGHGVYVRPDGSEEETAYFEKGPKAVLHPREKASGVVASEEASAPIQSQETLSWKPWDSLVTALSVRAARVGGASSRRAWASRATSGGELAEGIDLRSTIRGYASGSKDIHVFDANPRARNDGHDPETAFPVVWLFDGLDDQEGRWSLLRMPLKPLLAHSRDSTVTRRLGAESDVGFAVALARKSRGQPSRDRAASFGGYSHRLSGLALLTPQLATCRGFARWLNRVGWDRAVAFRGDEAIFEPLKPACARLGLKMGSGPWQADLVRFALAKAASRVTVVAPGGFHVPLDARRAAARSGRAIAQVPLSSLVPAHVEVIRTVPYLPGRMLGPEGRATFDPAAVAGMGEPADRYLELVPPELLALDA